MRVTVGVKLKGKSLSLGCAAAGTEAASPLSAWVAVNRACNLTMRTCSGHIHLEQMRCLSQGTQIAPNSEVLAESRTSAATSTDSKTLLRKTSFGTPHRRVEQNPSSAQALHSVDPPEERHRCHEPNAYGPQRHTEFVLSRLLGTLLRPHSGPSPKARRCPRPR